jgi:hypothetical protein
MIALYAVPVVGGTLLIAPAAGLADLRGTGYLLDRGLGSLAVSVFVASAPEPPERAALDRAARWLARRAATLATLEEHQFALPGPQGRWWLALLSWGWLLLLLGGGSLLQVAGGLWLALGLPWFRSASRRHYRRWHARAASGFASAIRLAPDDVPVRPVAHGGLAGLHAELARRGADGASPRELYELLATYCARVGLSALVPVYAALAAGHLPAGAWLTLPAGRPVGVTIGSQTALAEPDTLRPASTPEDVTGQGAPQRISSMPT